jgi:hypothetical protein
MPSGKTHDNLRWLGCRTHTVADAARAQERDPELLGAEGLKHKVADVLLACRADAHRDVTIRVKS